MPEIKTIEYLLLKQYKQLKQKLLNIEISEKNLPHSKAKTAEQLLSQNKSSNHHYIPKFFVDGFIGDDNLMFVYDKINDRIKKNKQGSKGVFFEIDRNSTDIGTDLSVSWIEEAYSVFDNIIPPSIKLLRSNIELDDDLRVELHAHLTTFFINLFWRNINNDNLFDRIVKNASITVTNSHRKRLLSNIEANEYKNEKSFQQLLRFQMTGLTLKSLTDNNQGIFSTKTITFPQKQLCIGDNPFLLQDVPKKHTDLLNTPAFIPISSTKLYVRNIDPQTQFDFHYTSILNSLIIDQSSKLICFADKTVLEAAIDYYNFAKKENLFDAFKQILFNF